MSQLKLYPFMIYWQRELIGTLSWIDTYEIEVIKINFWYPRPNFSWLATGNNFVTGNPPYPQAAEGWQYYNFDQDESDLFPF